MRPQECRRLRDYRQRMTAADSTDPGTSRAAARLRQLLDELEGAPTERRDDPGSQHQLDVCAEIEAIVLARIGPRPA